MKTITPPPSLNGSHLRTYEKIFLHPATHNLAWRDVLALFTHMGEVTEEPSGNLRLSRNGHFLILPVPRTKEVAGVDELMKLRHFLERSETSTADFTKPVDVMLVVIDHHRARLFCLEMKEAVPQLILPYEPDESFRHAHDDRDFFSGKEKPTPNSFFEPVAKALKNAAQILIFGTGTGTSCEMEQFTGWAKKHHPELARRITGTVTVDERHLTNAQLFAKALEFYGRRQTQ